MPFEVKIGKILQANPDVIDQLQSEDLDWFILIGGRKGNIRTRAEGSVADIVPYLAYIPEPLIKMLVSSFKK